MRSSSEKPKTNASLPSMIVTSISPGRSCESLVASSKSGKPGSQYQDGLHGPLSMPERILMKLSAMQSIAYRPRARGRLRRGSTQGLLSQGPPSSSWICSTYRSRQPDDRWAASASGKPTPNESSLLTESCTGRLVPSVRGSQAAPCRPQHAPVQGMRPSRGQRLQLRACDRDLSSCHSCSRILPA